MFYIFLGNIYYVSGPIMLTRDQRGHMLPPYLEYRAPSCIYLLYSGEAQEQGEIIIRLQAVFSPLKIVNSGHWSG